MPGFMEGNHPERRRDGPDEAAATSGSIPPGANARPMRRQSVAFIEALSCRECARTYPAEALHVCDYCFGPLEVTYDYDAIAANTTRETIAAGPPSIWRYANLLPATNDGAVDLGAGFTPLLRADRLAAELGLGELWIKNDTMNPTGSFKDRVVSVALARARPRGGAGGFGVAAHEDRQGVQGARPRRAARRGAARAGVGCPGARVLADRHRLLRGCRLRAPGQARHHRQVPRHRQPRR